MIGLGADNRPLPRIPCIWSLPLSASHLSTAAIVCALLGAVTCLLDWAVPPRSLAAATAAAHASRLDGGGNDAAHRVREVATAFPLQGTDQPLHGIWVMVLAALGAGLIAGGLLLAGQPGRQQVAEGTVRGAGVVLALGFLLVLMDVGSDVFAQRERGLPLWITGVLLVAGCLAATFASVKLAPSTASTPGEGTREVASTPGEGADDEDGLV